MSGQSYSIASASGMTVAAGEGNGHVDIPATQGVYLVTLDGKTIKVVVK